MTKEHPILFSAAMVRALLREPNPKTQTRRVITPQPPADSGEIRVGAFCPTKIDRHGEEYPGDEVFGAYDLDGRWGVKCPYGVPGDRLWVREKWLPDPPDDGTWDYYAFTDGRIYNFDLLPDRFKSPKHVYYAADCKDPQDFRWRPSIHMPRWASRITLEVVRVRVERVQDITPLDAEAEGYPQGTEVQCMSTQALNRLNWFAHLWDSINAKRGFAWASNPWVWVVEFRRIQEAAGNRQQAAGGGA